METKLPKRITYLFGAGASVGNGKLLTEKDASGIPVVENFNADIGIFLAEMKQLKGLELFGRKNENNIKFENTIKLFEEIYSNFFNMYSFDTYAKSIFEKGLSEELNSLKHLLKAYLVYRQTMCNPDPRYDLLFATLINRRFLPTHVNFLSWNYDTQVEISLSKFFNQEKDPFLHFIHYGFIPRNSYKSSLLKLNGTISVNEDFSKFEYCKHSSINKENTSIVRGMKTHNASEIIKNQHTPKMYFSWESKERFEEVMTYAENIISKTDILIIIGYSFPSLNRNTDKRLLELLSSDVKIYIQCGNEKDFFEIQSKIEELSNHKHGKRHSIATLTDYTNISFIPQNKEFYVPYEYEY